MGNSSAVEEAAVVGGDNQSYRERSQAVEHQQTPEDSANGFWDVACRVLGLAGGHRDLLDAAERESSVDQGVEDTEKAAGRALGDVRVHGPGILPVSEAQSVVRRPAAQDEAERHDQEADDGEDFDRGKEKLGLAVHAHRDDVENDQNNQDHSDPNRRLCVNQSSWFGAMGVHHSH